MHEEYEPPPIHQSLQFIIAMIKTKHVVFSRRDPSFGGEKNPVVRLLQDELQSTKIYEEPAKSFNPSFPEFSETRAIYL